MLCSLVFWIDSSMRDSIDALPSNWSLRSGSDRHGQFDIVRGCWAVGRRETGSRGFIGKCAGRGSAGTAITVDGMDVSSCRHNEGVTLFHFHQIGRLSVSCNGMEYSLES